MADKIRYYDPKTGNRYDEIPEGFRVATNDEFEQFNLDHPVELNEVVAIALAPAKAENIVPTTDTSTKPKKNDYATRFYNTSDWSSLFGNTRVLGVRRAWLRNPKYMQSMADAQTTGAAIALSPFAVLAAGEYVAPWLVENIFPYLTAKGWLAATEAAGNTPWWLTPTTATAIDAGLIAAPTGASVADLILNGPSVGNVTGTALGLGGLAFEAIPTIREGYDVARRIYDNGTLWDKYTTLGGRFGYYGNSFLRVLGTVSRNFGISSTPKHPELLRKMEGIPRLTEDGLIDFNSTRTGLLGEGHSNWTLDRPVISHKNGNWDGKDLFIVDPAAFQEAVPKENVISIEPSDMFVHGANAYIHPRHVTVVSGNPETLILARKLGMSTVSSPRLRRLYIPEGPKTGRFSLSKGNYGNRPYALEQQRLQQRRGAPTIEDFRMIEDYYGLESGVIPVSEYTLNSLSSAIRNMMGNPTLVRTWSYPNGREVLLIPGGTYLDNVFYEQSLIDKAPYRNVFYDPTSHVEINSGLTDR